MNKLKLAVAIAAFSVIAQSHAEINFRGFGSFVAGVGTGLEEGQSVLGYDDTVDYKRGSLLALQMDGDMGDGLSATMQLMSRGVNNFEVDVEWAYLTYQINDEIQLSAGRIRAPFYRYSDFLDVRYAYNWVSAPARVYAFEFPGFDGFSLLHTTSIGPIDSSLQVIAGELNDVSASTPIHFENLAGLSWIGSWEWLTTRASYLRAKVTIPESSVEAAAGGFDYLGSLMLDGGNIDMGGMDVAVPSVVDSLAGVALAAQPFDPNFSRRLNAYSAAYNQLGTAYVGSVDDIRMREDSGYYVGLGFSIDRNSLIVDGEWTLYEAEDSLVGKTSAYYLTAGWRFGPTVVYATYSREQMDAPNDVANLIPDISLVAAAMATDGGFNALGALDPNVLQVQGLALSLANESAKAVKGLAGAETDIVNTQLGVRWDFHPSAALKFAYEIEDNKITDEDGGVFRTAIDFVF